MIIFGSIVLILAAGLISIPVLILFIEAMAAIQFFRRVPVENARTARPVVAVLVPAHDEEINLSATLTDIKAQLTPLDRLLVVADNCTDQTAAVAFASGAEVTERQEPSKIGKGYALDCGIRHLSSKAPDVLVIIDADCSLDQLAIERLAVTCAITGRPAQALYAMKTPPGCSPHHQVGAFAWRVRNHLRPAGLQALNLPCQLMGTGMAFPWSTIVAIDMADGNIVEDLKLGLDLAAVGKPALFCPEARVTSHFPDAASSAVVQRSRWEQGHINMITTVAPAYLYKALKERNRALLALTLDLLVPPLSLLALLVAGSLLASAAAMTAGGPLLPLAISLFNAALLLLSVCAAWCICGRDILPASRILSIVYYVASKAGSYPRFLLRKTDARWVRTDRQKRV